MTVLNQAHANHRTARSKQQRRVIKLVLQYGLNLALTFVFMFPILFMVMSSLKPNNDAIFSDLRSFNAFLPVGNLTLDNYSAIFRKSQFGRFLFNSIFMSAIAIFLGVFINSMAAYALSRLKWKGQTLVMAGIIATLIIPFETVVIPLLLLVSKLPNFGFTKDGLAFTQGWLNTYQVQIIPFITSAFSIFLFYQFFKEIPVELDEAALVDGAGKFTIYRHIILPNSGPVIATVAILTFLGSWNSFLWPTMVVQSEDIRPVMIGMQYFFQQNTQWGEVMAYATMVTLPVLALFMAFQRSFVQSITSSGVKG